jgi:multiple sugar transport system permease protein
VIIVAIVNKGKLVMTVIMFAIGIAFMLPLIWMVSASFKPEIEVFTYPIQWIPRHWQIVKNYNDVWTGQSHFLLYYWNSIKVSVLTTLLSIIVSSMAAYGFSKIKFAGRNQMFLFVLATYMIPAEATLVPLFILYRYMHLYNTHVGLILLGGFSVLGTFLLRQFFMGIHDEYIESAKIDGAGHIHIFLTIAFPLIRSAVATYAILRFMWTWNDFQTPFIFLKDEAMYTIQVGMSAFANRNGKFYSLIMAGSVSAIIPLLLIIIIAQKHVIAGISLGGVKG